MKQKIPTESEEGKTLSAWLKLKGIRHTHIPNETSIQNWGYLMKQKAMGKAAGVPDYLIVLKDKLIFIELKRTKGGVLSTEQNEWREALNKIPNVGAFMAKGADEAIKIVEKYL